MMKKSRRHGPGVRRLWAAAFTATVALVATSGALVAPAHAAQPAPTSAQAPALPMAAEPANARDGQSAFSAAASCWEIKQLYPSSASGIYWLQTPAMVSPQQFYCDQSTDGGGWVLIGRGNYDWAQGSSGKGSAKHLREVVTGADAMDVDQLPSATVNALLNNSSPQNLSDGIRLRRAMNTGGTSWQEARLWVSKMPDWSWTFGGAIPITRYSFNGVSQGSSYTYSYGWDNGYNRVRTQIWGSGSSYVPGFAYGTGVAGSNSSSSYIYTRNNNPYPFTQMYLRPQLTTPNLNYGSVPASGTEAVSIDPLVSDRTSPTGWGVTGLSNGNTEEDYVEVSALAQVGEYMYVGGNFSTVLRNGDTATAQAQPYLAAFNINTGEWLSSFRPKLNRQVKSLLALPDGQLLVGGQFSTVNGQNIGSLVALDPSTGATSTTWNMRVYNGGNGSIATVREMHIQDNWLYLGGSFTHLVGGASSSWIAASNAGRFDITTQAPDSNWNPGFNGNVWAIYPSDKGDRVYASGYFTYSGRSYTNMAAALTSGPGAGVAINWNPRYSSTGLYYQQAVWEYGDVVALGGSQHSAFFFDRNTMQLIPGGGVTFGGGDFQEFGEHNGILYGTNHSKHYMYVNGTTYDNGASNPLYIGPYTEVKHMDLVCAWEMDKNRKYSDQFDPKFQNRDDIGGWAFAFDTNGAMWVGGDFIKAQGSDGGMKWAQGFVRFPAKDTTPPSKPSGLKWTNSGANSTFSWNPATDDAGSLSYELLVNGRVRATSTTPSLTTPAIPDGNSVVVRAVDAAGNRSASTPVITTSGNVPDNGDYLVSPSASWQYSFESDSTPQGWTAPEYNAASWRTGQAPLGWGSSDIATQLTSSANPRPLTAYFRNTFTVSDPSSLSGLKISTLADDGVAVYLNGKELTRSNLPSGALTATTYAVNPVRLAAAKADPIEIVVPAAQLRAGTNVIALEVHANWRATTDLTMMASATKLTASGPASLGAPADFTAEPASTTNVGLSWSAVSGASGYEVQRDGTPVAWIDSATTTSHTDQVPAAGTYTYTIRAIDDQGRFSPEAAATVNTQGKAPLIASDATWRYSYSQAAPAANWKDPDFDDSAFTSGQGPIGFGNTEVGTNIDIQPAASRPLAAYLRTTVSIDDPSKPVTLTVVADDGAAIYVNGTEVKRINMPEGTLTSGSYALTAVRTSVAKQNPVTIQVPADLLVAGNNTIAAEVHLNYRATADIYFGLTAAR